MDENQLERAEALNDRLRDAEISNRRAKVPPPGKVGQEYCDCGTQIPFKRRERGYDECIECVSRRERARGHRG